MKIKRSMSKPGMQAIDYYSIHQLDFKEAGEKIVKVEIHYDSSYHGQSRFKASVFNQEKNIWNQVACLLPDDTYLCNSDESTYAKDFKEAYFQEDEATLLQEVSELYR